jgi:hypothetical protein
MNNNNSNINIISHFLSSQRTSTSDLFVELLHNCGLTKSEFHAYSKNKTFIKLTEAIEICYNIIIDKNTQINLLEIENDKLNIKNFELNKENMSLVNGNKQLNNSYLFNRNFEEDSKSNNTSQLISSNNRSVNLNSLTTYRKLLEQKQIKDKLNISNGIDNNDNIILHKIEKQIILKKTKTSKSTVGSISSQDFKQDSNNRKTNEFNDEDNSEDKQSINTSFISQDSTELKNQLDL